MINVVLFEPEISVNTGSCDSLNEYGVKNGK